MVMKMFSSQRAMLPLEYLLIHKYRLQLRDPQYFILRIYLQVFALVVLEPSVFA
jgi:hypothetical protein